MKTLIATSILLAVLLVVITVNFFLINRIADQLEDMITALPAVESNDCADAAREIQNYLESKENLIGFSVGYVTLDRVCEQTVLLVACAEIGDIYGFQSARALLQDAVKDMRRAEQFSVGNLF